MGYNEMRFPSEGLGMGPRHLLYHVHPIAGSDIWVWNLVELQKRLDLFDGQRVCAITTGTNLDPPEEVQDILGPSFEYIARPNNPALREVVSHNALWERVIDLPGITFYAHAKGVTRFGEQIKAILRWVKWFYELNLDDLERVETVLTHHPLAGAFRKAGICFGHSRSCWHYSGSFYWVRNFDMAAKNWKEIDKIPHGVEAWPSLHFPIADAGCLVPGTNMGPDGNMYSWDFQESKIVPAIKNWYNLTTESKT